MDQQQQIRAFMQGRRWQAFEAFVDETDRRIQVLEKKGYTKDQAIRVLMLYAMQPQEK